MRAEREASGQHTRLQRCRPHARRAVQGLSQRISRGESGNLRSWQGMERVVEPHRQGITSGTVQGGQGPIWPECN